VKTPKKMQQAPSTEGLAYIISWSSMAALEKLREYSVTTAKATLI